jgi:surface antigen
VRLLCATTLAAAALGATAHAASGPIVYGYPWTSRCPAAGIADKVDRFGMYACNCTSYVAWALWVNHQRVDWFIPGAMNAYNWPHVARLSNLRVDRRPTVGSVAVWSKLAKPFGHVAYVTGVHGGLIDVAEYNYPAPGNVQTFVFDVRQGVGTAGAVFIHVPRRPPDESPR